MLIREVWSYWKNALYEIHDLLSVRYRRLDVVRKLNVDNQFNKPDTLSGIYSAVSEVDLTETSHYE